LGFGDHGMEFGDAFCREPLFADPSKAAVAFHIIQGCLPLVDHHPGRAFGDRDVYVEILERQDEFHFSGVDSNLPGNRRDSQVAVKPQVHPTGEQFF